MSLLSPVWADAKPLIAPLVDLVGPLAANLIVTLAVIAIAVALGTWMARQFRMPDHGWKFGVVIFSVLAGVVVTYLGWPPKLGIDLSGGVLLVYQVDHAQQQAGESVDMQALVAAVGRRVNPDGLKEVTIRPYGVDQIEIIVPRATDEEVAQIKNTITNLGTLEFRILATQKDARHQDAIQRARASGGLQTVTDEEGHKLARWVPLAKGKTEDLALNPDFLTRKVGEHTEILVMLDPYDVTGDYLRTVRQGNEPTTGKPNIEFSFNVLGAQKFGSLTTENQPDNAGRKKNLAILMDNVVVSAPVLNAVITSHGVIEGEFTPAEIEEYITTLRAGKLPATLEKEPLSELLTGPTLGADTIRASSIALVVSTGLVLLFMLVYYRFAGIVACFALLLNLLLIVAIMISIKAAFTLPGLAGLVLTIGMAVDANILIFERIREEQARGATLRMCIRNGFSRAMSAIIDSNVTTLFSAIVLYVIGTDQVKGFAVTMFLGIILSMFTGVFCSRVVFDLAERLSWIRQVNMMKLLTTTNIDFFGWRKPALAFSALMFAVGVVSVVGRGSNLFGIDFLGGTRVELQFTQPQDIAFVRRSIEKSDKLPGATVSDVSVVGEDRGARFMVDTTETDPTAVKDTLDGIFEGRLATNRVEDARLSSIAAQAATPPALGAPSGATPADPGVDGDGAAGLLAQEEAPPSDGDTTPPAALPTAEGTPPPSAFESSTPPALIEERPTDPFEGGTQIDLRFAQPIHHDALEAIVAAEVEKVAPGRRFQLFNKDYVSGANARFADWQIKIDAPGAAGEQIVAAVRSEVDGKALFPSAARIGGAVARNTKEQALYGVLASCLSIIVYLWVRFQKLAYGVAAVAALVHDVGIMLFALAGSYYVAPYLGFAMIDPFKIDLPIMAAFLTIIGFSVNDTIVIFDRIRELKGKSPYVTPSVINQAVNQTLSRTILTFLTAFISVFILYVYGGSSIHGFAFAMLVGLISGTYSTVYIASPVLLWMGEGRPQTTRERERSEIAAA